MVHHHIDLRHRHHHLSSAHSNHAHRVLDTADLCPGGREIKSSKSSKQLKKRSWHVKIKKVDYVMNDVLLESLKLLLFPMMSLSIG